jgi:hypothetical protein
LILVHHLKFLFGHTSLFLTVGYDQTNCHINSSHHNLSHRTTVFVLPSTSWRVKRSHVKTNTRIVHNGFSYLLVKQWSPTPTPNFVPIANLFYNSVIHILTPTANIFMFDFYIGGFNHSSYSGICKNYKSLFV